MSWIITGTQKLDPDAAIYIDRVEAADGQSLEEGVRLAYSTFVSGCKADGIWNAIKASCILAGARTLSGALVPLAGVAPTNYNFVSGDYNRETGLKGDGSTKYLDSNRNNNADPQNSAHRSAYQTTAPTINGAMYYGSDNVGTAGGDNLYHYLSGFALNGVNRGTGAGVAFSLAGEAITNGFKGTSRVSSANFTVRTSGLNTLVSATSSTPTSENIAIFARTPSSPVFYSDARLSFYSIGEALDLAAFDSRVTTLMSDLAAAIP